MQKWLGPSLFGALVGCQNLAWDEFGGDRTARSRTPLDQQHLPAGHCHNVGRKNVERDLRSGRLVRQTVKWSSVMRLAARLSEQHSSVYGTRSLDIIHVATAKLARIEEFISFDLAKEISLQR